jgi:hypothetical protein
MIGLAVFAFENDALLTPFDTKNDTKGHDFRWLWLSTFERKYPSFNLTMALKEPTK